jgi:filamentous hemagglutinin family protein
MKLNWKTLFLLTTCCTLGLMTSARAQVSSDGTLSTTVTSPNNLNFTINNGDRVGGNLFHSFREFSVPNGGSAVFQNALDVQNIISRVTGGSLSQINGLIQAQGTANLFLLNPAGISFGQNARLNIGGSFFATTADSLLFGDGIEFSATNPQAPPLLTVNIPIGLRFRNNPGEIRVQGSGQNNGLTGISGRFDNPTLDVPIGQNLTLVGGNVNLDGGVLQATGGRVQLGGLTAAGTVGINANGTLNFPDGVARGDVSLTNRAGINVITDEFGGGSININARNIGISGLSLLTAGIPENLGTVNNSAGNITLNATGETRIDQSLIENNVNLGTIADSSNINITTGSFVLTNRAELDASNLGEGQSSSRFAGDVRVTANGPITVDGAARIISDGFFGFVFLTSNNDSINISDNSLIRTSGDNDITDNFSEININAPKGSVFLNNVFQISTTNQGTGFAGDIRINARDQISIKDSQILSQGNQGRIFIGDANSFSPALIMIEGANTLLRTNNNTAPNRNAGSINIAAGRVVMNLGELSSSTSGSGRAGDISVQASGAVEFVDNALFSNVQERAQNGQAGNINIKAGSFSLLNGAQLQSRVLEDARGNGGNVTIDVQDGTVRIAGRNSERIRSAIFSDVESEASGNAGNIFINAGSIFTDDALLRARNEGNGSAGNISLQVGDAIALTNGSVISSSIFGRGNAGNVTLRAENGDISLAGGSNIFSTVESGGTGNAGKIDVITRNLSLTDGSQLQTSLRAGQQNNAGNITVQASGTVRIAGRNSDGNRSGIFSDVLSGISGNGGNITINAASIFTDGAVLVTSNAGRGNAGNISLKVGDAIALTNGSVIISSIFGRGNAGDVTLRAENGDISFAGGSDIFSTVESGGMGNAGKIDIISRNLSLTDGSLINSSTFGQGNAGNISLQVGDAIALSNSSQIASVVGQGGEGIGGDIDIRGRSLTLTGGGAIGTVLIAEGNGLSGGKGRAGNIDINATDFVNIFGVGTAGFSGGLFTSAERGTTAISPQAAGNINLTTGNFRIADGAVINALTSNSGDAGNITINANTFTASGGGQVITTTLNSGNAGNINLNIRDRITISGSDPNFNQRIQGTFDNQGAASGIFANTAPDSTGNGGNITIQQEQNSFPTIAISDGGQVTVDSQGQGRGGEISITGNSLTLDRGIINASTTSGDGGNINLRLRNFIRLRNESLISASAGGNGNGGNITINSPFIVAFPRNNDITANAGTGSGGQVIINATLFGIAPLSAEDLRRLRPDDLDPRQLPTSDITAISRDNPSLSLPVQVNSPDVDPSRGLVELPEAVTDPTQKVAENPCRQGIGNEFFITGRGGLPTTPNQTLNSDNVRVDLLQPVASSGNSPSATKKPATPVTARRVPAQGWIFNDKGQVVLTAYDPTNTDSQRPWRTAAACPAR